MNETLCALFNNLRLRQIMTYPQIILKGDLALMLIFNYFFGTVLTSFLHGRLLYSMVGPCIKGSTVRHYKQ